MEKLDELSKRLIEIRTERRELKQQDSQLSEEFDEITRNITNILQEMGVVATRTAYASLSLSKKTVPNTQSWDEFKNFVRKRDALFLYQKRISVSAWEEMRELLKEEQGDDAEVPGTVAYEKLTLNVRAR